MNPLPVDAYAYANRLHAAHPAEKMLFSGLVMAITLVSGSPLVALAALALVVAAVTRLAGIGPGAFWRFLRLPLGFLTAGALTIAITVVDSTVARAVAVGPWRVGITEPALVRAVGVLATSLACVSAGLFLALTTPIVDVAGQLRRWHMPALVIDLMLLTYRFVFVLVDTAHAMHLAQEARLGYATPWRALRSAATLSSVLLMRAMVRAEGLFNALTARGYVGDLAVLEEDFAWSRRNLALVGVVTLALTGLALGTRLGGVG